MTNPTIKIANVETGEEIVRKMTKAESENLEMIRKLAIEKQILESAKEAARQSAVEKLAALGLTADEISAITGA